MTIDIAISRQAAIDAIYARYIGGKEAVDKAPANDQYAEGIDEAVCAVEDLPPVNPQPKTDWIPVSERLPHKGEYGKVLVTYIPSGGTLWTTVIIAQYSDLMGIAKPSFHIGEVGKESFQNITEQVIAWMPLPTPYKGEREDEE